MSDAYRDELAITGPERSGCLDQTGVERECDRVVQSGRMHVIHDDGSEGEIGPGEAYVIEPGHDAWVVGDEPMVGFEFESPTAEVFAKG